MKTKTCFFISLTVIFLILSGLDAMAGKKKVMFIVSEPDSKIYLDGKLMGSGPLEVIVQNSACVVLKVEKLGYLTETIKFCNKDGFPPPPKTHNVIMEKDDAYEASDPTEIANIDLEVKTTKTELEAWKLISQIISSYFDVIEITDRETGYLRTAWTLQMFKRNTIRTRVIIKLGSTDPLTYKIKLVSEESQNPQTSVKSDELFREWDRVLRKYKEVVREIQSRLSS